MDRLAALEAFVRVAENRSFSEAARRLRTSKSGVSRLVSALEVLLYPFLPYTSRKLGNLLGRRLEVRRLQGHIVIGIGREIQAGFIVQVPEFRRRRGGLVRPGQADMAEKRLFFHSGLTHKLYGGLRKPAFHGMFKGARAGTAGPSIKSGPRSKCS